MSTTLAVHKAPHLFAELDDMELNGHQIALVRLGDQKRISASSFSSFSDLLLESETIYPGIDKWFVKKVVPGMRQGSRIAYVVFHQGKAIAESIVKFGARTKMCSMRVDPRFQGKGIGPFLFGQIAAELDYSVSSIHFTAPESLVEERRGLFDDLGFVFAGKSRKSYRSGDDELVFKATATDFKRRSLELVEKKIARRFTRGAAEGILLSIRNRYLERIFSGKKHIELRRKFSEKLEGCVALLYAPQPVGKVMGDAVISGVVTDTPERIWKGFHYHLGCTREEYESYCGSADRLSALFLTNICRYPRPFDWEILEKVFTGFTRPPQNYQRIPKSTLSFWGSLASGGEGSADQESTESSLGL